MNTQTSSMPLWQQAAAFAARAHQGQLRQDGVTPYASHAMRVALTVATLFQVHDEETLAAAMLHDVIEDTNYDFDDIEEAFGREVADIVAALTKDMRLPEVEREPAYDAQLAIGPWQARLIKLADAYDNYCDASSESKQAKRHEKAERAIALAEGDERLAHAASLLARLVSGDSTDRPA